VLPGAPRQCQEARASRGGRPQRLPAAVLVEVVHELPQQRTVSRVDDEDPPACSTSFISRVVTDSLREERRGAEGERRSEPSTAAAPAAATCSRGDDQRALEVSSCAENGPSFIEDGVCRSFIEEDNISFCDSTSAGSTSTRTDVPEPSAAALPERERAVAAFLRENGFHSVGQSRRQTLVGSTYPLHCAVSLGLVRMTQLLLDAGANASQKNSWGQTPLDVARRCNKKGSHDAVLEVLQVHWQG